MLLLGVIGFGLTLIQIGKVKTVASAQRDAINSLSFRLSQLDIIAECAKAESAISEIKKLTFSRCDIPLDTIDKLATPFISILEGSASVSEDVRIKLRSAINNLNKISSASTREPPEDRHVGKQLSLLRDYHGIIVKIRSQVQEDHNP